MDQNNYSEKQPADPVNTQEATPSEKEGYTSRQKLIAAMSGIAMFIVIGSGIAYNKGQEHPDPTENTTSPIEQSEPAVENNSTNKADNISDSKKAKVDANTSYKNCPDLKAASCSITYMDPGSGQTVTTTPNKTPEKINVGENPITMLGFSALVNDYGMTFEQIKALKSEFNDYSSTLKTPIKELSFTVKSVETTINPDTGDVEHKFTVTLDRDSTLTAKVEYFGIDDPSLKLYNPEDETQIYSSK